MKVSKDKLDIAYIIIAYALAFAIIFLSFSCVSKKTIYNYHNVKSGISTDTLRQTKLILKAK